MALPVLRSKDFVHQPRYQLWTDALCFREMAKQAPNNYLRSMCVRNAVLAAWTTLEMACCDSLSVPELPDRIFREGLKKALNKAGRPAINFGSGLWQRVLKLQESRNDYTHMGGKLINRLPPVSVAEHAIITIREAIHDIYGRMGTPSPSWVDADQSGGWPQTGGFSATAHLTLICFAPRMVRWLDCTSFPNSFKQNGCWFIARVLRYKFATECFSEDGLLEVVDLLPCDCETGLDLIGQREKLVFAAKNFLLLGKGRKW
jgi:hypothetical protein